MNWTSVVTAIVAVYAAVLSTYTLIVNQRGKRRRIKVEITNGFLTSGPELSPHMMFIGISNPGDRAVMIQSTALRVPGGARIVFPSPQSDVQFPHDLGEGLSCTVWIESESVSATLTQASLKLDSRGSSSSLGNARTV